MLIIDTEPLLATADRADTDHERCRAVLEGHPGPLVTMALVIAEAGWLIRRKLGVDAEVTLYESISAGEVTVEPLGGADWSRIAALLTRYADLGLDAADASIMTIAERLGQSTVATLDHRDFRVVRPAHCEAFELLP